VFECAPKGTSYDFEHRIFVNNGTEIKYIRAIGSPIVDKKGNIVGLNGIGQDFTDRKLIEIQNEKNQKRLEEAQQISKIGSWEWDLVSGNLYWSDEHFRIFEIPFDTDPSVLFETYRSKIHPDDLKVMDPMVENAIKTGQPFEFNHRALLKDGSIRHVRGLGNAIYGSDNKIIGVHGTAQDITEGFLQEQRLNGVDHFVLIESPKKNPQLFLIQEKWKLINQSTLESVNAEIYHHAVQVNYALQNITLQQSSKYEAKDAFHR
jgi:PAS domain-containing protein